MSLCDLPQECLVLVLRHLSARDVCAAGAVCRVLALSARCGSLWRFFCKRDWDRSTANDARRRYAFLARFSRVTSLGNNEGPEDWGVPTAPQDEGGGQLGQPWAGTLNLVGIAKVACGGYHSFFVDYNGRVLACGANAFGQLGMGDRVSRLTPQRVPVPFVCGQVALGFAFSFLVSRDGSVWSCGFAKNGRCAVDCATIKDESEDGFPLLLEFNRCSTFDNLARPLQLACGSGHALCLTPGGKVYSFGRNDCGQCGVANRVDEIRTEFAVGVESTPRSHIPQLVLHDARINAVFAGSYHSGAAGLGTNLVVTWGSNIQGESGPRELGRTVNLPHFWADLLPIVLVQLPQDATLVVMSGQMMMNGELSTIKSGSCPWMRLALPFGVVDGGARGKLRSKRYQSLLENLGPVLDVQCSANHCLVLTEHGAEEHEDEEL